MLHSYYPDILKLIPDQAKVLDLGCGDGSLLAQLRDQRSVIGYGIEIEFESVKSCIQKGIPVFQGNLNEGLQEFKPNSFDWVLLSQTLQQIDDPVTLLNRMCEVGKRVIVTFPNFGHILVRLHHGFSGESPKTKTLPYDWFNTPNIRVITIQDFRSLCEREGIKIHQEIPLFSPLLKRLCPKFLYNLFSKKGLFVISKDSEVSE